MRWAGLHGAALVDSHATGTETNGTVTITYDGGGADTFLTLIGDGATDPDAYTWWRGDGAQRIVLRTGDLYPGSLYDYSVTANSLYGAVASMPVQVLTADHHAPSFALARLKARSGRVTRIRITASDNSPWIGYRVRVQRGHRTIKTFQQGTGSQPNLALRAQAALRWRVPRTPGARLRVCGYAFDDAGHRSGTVCRKVRVSL